MCRSGKEGGGGKTGDEIALDRGKKKKERKWDQNRKRKKRRVEALKSCGQQRGGGGVTSSGGEKRVTHLTRGWRKVESFPSIQVVWSTCEEHTHTHTPP